MAILLRSKCFPRRSLRTRSPNHNDVKFLHCWRNQQIRSERRWKSFSNYLLTFILYGYQRNSSRVILLSVAADNSMSFLIRSIFSSERAVIRLPEFYLFLFRLLPCDCYFLTFSWIVFLQGGTWLNCHSHSYYPEEEWIEGGYGLHVYVSKISTS